MPATPPDGGGGRMTVVGPVEIPISPGLDVLARVRQRRFLWRIESSIEASYRLI